MPVNISLTDNGKVEVRIRIKRTINGVPTVVVNLRRYLPEIVFRESDWYYYNGLKTPNAREGFLNKNPDFRTDYDKVETIRVKVNEAGENLTSEMMDEIIHEVVYSEEIAKEEARRERAAARKAAAAERKRQAEVMTLSKFIDVYIDSIKTDRKTNIHNGRKYSQGSKFNTANALKRFKDFMEDTGVIYDFGDVDIECYNKYVTWLMSRDISESFTRGKLAGKEPDDDGKKKKKKVKKQPLAYTDATIGRFIRQLKAVLRAAEVRGYPVNPAYRSQEFKAKVSNADTIYLTMKEVEAIENLDLSTYNADSGRDHQIELARDVFMIGVWTAQRVSDYNNIGPHNIRTFDNNGKQQLMLSIHQQKTGRYVEIPCNSKLQAIIAKYPDGIPHISDQWLNKYVKILGKLAGIDELVEIKETRGGVNVTNCYPKYNLICTHTARRTGATLMYLAGIPIYDIMKVTGHTSLASLERYIRADKLEVAQNLAARYDYFK